MTSRTTTSNAPPYTLPSLPDLDSEAVKNLDRRAIQKFLRIEGLLRAKGTWALYERAVKRTCRKRSAPPVNSVELWEYLFGDGRLKLRGKRDAWIRRLLWDDSLQRQFDVEDGWAILLRSHHRYLLPQSIPFRIGEGIVDLSILHSSRDLSFELKYLEEKQSRYLYVMIDSVEVSSSDLRKLQDLLSKRQRDYSRETGLIPSLDMQDIQAWLRYLQCYDAHKYNGKSAAEVASHFYDAPTGRRLTDEARKKKSSARRQVVRACQNVAHLIESAIAGPWILTPL